MKVNRQELLNAINKVSKAISSRAVIPAQTMVLFQFSGDGLLVSGTNTELSITKSIQCITSGDSSICCPPDSIKNLLAGLNVDGVDLEVFPTKMVFIGGGVRATIGGIPANGFPKLPVPHKKLFELTDEMIDTMTELFVPFCPNERDIAHPWLNGVLLSCKDNTLTIQSGNGYRYSHLEQPLKHSDFLVVVDAKAISEFEYGMTLYLNEEKTQVVARNDSATISSTLYESGYFDWNNVRRTSSPETSDYYVNSKVLLDAVGLASAVIDKTYKYVQFDISKDGLTVRVPKTALGEFEQTVQCRLEGEPLSIGFDVRYLKEFLSAVSGEVHFNSKDVEKPQAHTLVTIEGIEGYTHLIMPMRFVDPTVK
jgi:DNA polymerase III subunit beta